MKLKTKILICVIAALIVLVFASFVMREEAGTAAAVEETEAPAVEQLQVEITPEPPVVRCVNLVQPVVIEPAATILVDIEPEDDECDVDVTETSELLPILESVPFDAETQAAIFDLCDQNVALFCSVMAIGYVESGHQADAVGDKGAAIGWLQVQPKWNWDRMADLAVSAKDLKDPVKCAAVAIAYIRELMSDYNAEPGSHFLFMAYNYGPLGALNNTAAGVYSSYYSRTAMGYYEAYMKEIAEEAA